MQTPNVWVVVYIYCGNMSFQWNVKRCSRTIYWRLFSTQSKNRIPIQHLSQIHVYFSLHITATEITLSSPTNQKSTPETPPSSRSFTQLQTRHCQLLKKYHGSNKARWYKTCIRFQPMKNNEKRKKRLDTITRPQQLNKAKRVVLQREIAWAVLNIGLLWWCFLNTTFWKCYKERKWHFYTFSWVFSLMSWLKSNRHSVKFD